MKFGYKIAVWALTLTLTFLLPANQAFSLEEATVKRAPMTIKDCINTALQNSPNVKKSKLNYESAKADVGISKSVYAPTIGLGTGYNYNKNDTSYTNINQNYYAAEASLNQLIWDFGKSYANIKMQGFNKITALFNFDNTVLTTIFDVKVNYYGVLAAEANVDIAKYNVDMNERNYQRTKAFFEEGIKSKIDLVNAEVYLSDSKVTLVKAENSYKNALIKLNNSMYMAYTPIYEIEDIKSVKQNKGLSPVNFLKIDEKKDISAPPKGVNDAFLISKVEKVDIVTNYKFEEFPYSFEECLDLAKKNRPDLKAYESTLKAMQENLLYVKREYYPSLSGKVGYAYRDLNSTKSLTAAVNLTTNLNVMQVKNDIDKAKVKVELAQNEIDLLNQNIYFQIQDAYVNMLELERQIPLLAIKVKQTKENLELADGRYSVGLGDYIELQDAKVNYNSAQYSYVQTVQNYNVARAALERVVALEQDTAIKIEDIKNEYKKS
ncbi:MAG: TolC family protein [Candidatus Gastranaerophilales bacterium]|nr:TolC family protein [Candidatus Gastranaerophilales bacterium]